MSYQNYITEKSSKYLPGMLKLVLILFGHDCDQRGVTRLYLAGTPTETGDFFRDPIDLAELFISLFFERHWWKRHGQVVLLCLFETHGLVIELSSAPMNWLPCSIESTVSNEHRLNFVLAPLFLPLDRQSDLPGVMEWADRTLSLCNGYVFLDLKFSPTLGLFSTIDIPGYFLPLLPSSSSVCPLDTKDLGDFPSEALGESLSILLTSLV
ncbi:hypothetical protein U1Q18_033095 [Sarracenia purpurea var. burkii]